MHPHPASGAAESAPSPAPRDTEAYPLEFTGSAGAYFRVWIVNLLLCCVTVGIYTPWARRRTAQYFYSNTLVAHSPLEFTGRLRSMVLGFVLVLLLLLARDIASITGQKLVVTLLLLAAAALVPWAWGSAMRFRFRATRWRGLRLQFAARWREVYRASWPLWMLVPLWWVLLLGLKWLAPEMPNAPEPNEKTTGVTPAGGAWLLLGLVLTLLCIIRIDYNCKNLLVCKARWGAEQGHWKLVYMDFVKVWLASVALFMLCVLGFWALSVVLTGQLFGVLAWLFGRADPRTDPMSLVLTMLIIYIVGALLALLLSAPARAYREARMFQLVWNHIGIGQVARFKCRLAIGRYVLLRIRNLLLVLLTLGFYRPYARVSEYRMRLESVTLYVNGGVEQVVGAMVRQQPGGLGDALADAVGLDLIG
ncbi:DUF898 domain-containing protein [Verminephrobacter eiseniae]|uniref:YjgN family protein n=1 Tax=Verminephrobacter eiseniae TaxID=364317 RepID=UPI0022371E25|nr:YjgN family protein [Verminephrobacter eiseniae]MCW5262831.1 DUF898 domain-containing protein [Verminephrobacter eiseniae]